VLTFLSGLTPEAAVFFALMLFGSSLVPFFLLVDAEHLTPRFVRELPATAREATASAALSAAVLLLLLTAPKGVTR
jgi:hypothetical protein